VVGGAPAAAQKMLNVKAISKGNISNPAAVGLVDEVIEDA
jgi:hypothetical protein